MFEHKLLYKTKGPVPEGMYREAIGKAVVRRAGGDLTIVGASIMALRAARPQRRRSRARASMRKSSTCAVCGRSTSRPSHDSVRKTRRLLIVYEGVKTMGIGAEIAA